MTKKIALIDGYGFVFRAFHSLPPLTRSDGTPVGAVYGFTNMLIKLIAGLDVSHVAVVFDSGSKTFRNEIFPEYKANRPPCPEELKPQFPIVRQAAEALNLAILEKIGFEADDIIATIAKKSAAEGHEVLIVSSDKDLMQLVGDKIFMFDAMKNRMIGEAEVKEKFAVNPDKVLDVLSLMGDASDNVPGVRGIGPKTAAELIDQFGNLENIFLNLDKIKQEKRRQLLADGEQKAILSKQLITLKEDVEMGITTADLEVKKIDPQKFISFLEEQGFRSLVTRVKKEFGISDEQIPAQKNEVKVKEKSSFFEVKKTKIESPKIIDKIFIQALANGQATIDFEKDFFTISTCKTGENPNEIFYTEICEEKTEIRHEDLFSFQEIKSGIDLNSFAKIFENDAIKKIFFDAKPFLKLAKTVSFDDVSLINYLLNSSSKNNLCDLANINLDENLEERGFNKIFSELEKEKTPQEFSDEQKKSDFFCFKNFAIYQIYKILYPQIFTAKLSSCYLSYELPLLQVLANIESNGIKVDVAKLNNLSHEFGEKINSLTQEIYALAGEKFNIASSKQLSEILFTKLGLDSSKKSKKTGALSTNVGVLEELEEEGHPIARKILEFRKYSKLKNTYTDALPKEINEKTGRIHTTLSSISTITGRLNSTAPNLQNIPIKAAEGKKIRECFIAQAGNSLISADYSQIELRVIAHVAKMESLIQAFADGKDIHRITASQVFKIPENEIDDETRSKAKAINFGIIYGISAFGLARQLGIGRKEAAEYIKSYFEAYPGIEAYMKKFIDFARTNGFVETLSGRKCFIHEINNKNPMIRQEAERLAINAPIQGGAADIIKKAMINIDKKLREKNLRSKIVLQIHDELLIEAPQNEVEIASNLLKSEMEKAVIISAPLKVDVIVGDSWK
jgi:DNA polymerase-1